ncbi:hypothetical protein BD311DRAFT_745232 [Dichomitus squalens]|uniref:Homeodomain-like protein n=1 Tax=Dichomitus squalens TaxID=114155 RepID=A0A4Q9N6Y9_9APHY|nr:hypothetical protein BD311DRAFT_745232 [Dichomitus squalens]
MGERGVGNPWTTYEDNLLIQAVAIHGENDNWKAVASLVPGRTNKACRKRWLHSLSPNVKKTAWTPEEDQLLLSLYATHGTKWSVIARNIPGRTDDACSKRYREALDPSLKRDDWTADEDAKLSDAYTRLGGKWGLIGQELSRSGLGCRNRWRMLERRRAAQSRDTAARGEALSTTARSSPAPTEWTPAHVHEPSFWDGRSPQYVAPSALHQGSPAHVQESHVASYSPEQILSGAHLGGSPSDARDPASFQYTSSSLTAALSHPSSVAPSPNPHAYYHSEAYSPRPSASEPSAVRVPSSDNRAGTHGSHDYAYIDHQDNVTTQTYQFGRCHTTTGVASVDEFTGSASSAGPVVGPQNVIISDSPASPSQASSPSPPGSPRSISGNEQVNYSSPPGPSDNSVVPRSYYRTDAEKAPRTPPTRKTRDAVAPVRLSSLLPATADPSVLAYACGHHDCWPEDMTSSRNAYATSKELSDHSKVDHCGDLGGSKPFRCGLTGCEKSWKSINGLQYHLQISKYHFQQALATRADTTFQEGSTVVAPDTPTNGQHARQGDISMSDADERSRTLPQTATKAPVISQTPTALMESPEKTGSSSAFTSQKPKRKLHPCPHPGCSKQYKQLSGLRYHLSHGHVDALPLQLEVVPPTLARMVAEKECSRG